MHRGGQSNLMLYNTDRTKNQLGFIVPADDIKTVVKVFNDPQINISAVEVKLGGHGNPELGTLPTTETPLCAAEAWGDDTYTRYNCHTDEEMMAHRFCEYHDFEKAQSFKKSACQDCSCAVYNTFEGEGSNPGRRLDGSHNMLLSEITCVKDAVMSTDASWIHVSDFWDEKQWTHACVSVDVSGTMRAFKNGKEMKCTNVDESACNANGVGSNGKVPNRAHRSKSFIGRASVPVTEEYFDGAISDLIFFDGHAVVTEEAAAEVMRGAANYVAAHQTTATPTTVANIIALPANATTAMPNTAASRDDAAESDAEGSVDANIIALPANATTAMPNTAASRDDAANQMRKALLTCSQAKQQPLRRARWETRERNGKVVLLAVWLHQY